MKTINEEGNDLIGGNLYDKHGSSNPVVRMLMRRFYNSINNILIPLDIENALEIGCGDGFVINYIKELKKGLKTKGIDVSTNIIELARNNYPDTKFSVQSVYNLSNKDNSFDLLIASEMMEHLKKPEKAIIEIKRVTKKYCLFSVPREPLWRILNILRLSYLREKGNTPGHVQHWNKKGFVDFLSRHFIIEKILMPTPWIMVLCRKQEE